MNDASPTAEEEELRRLLEAGDDARRALSRLEQDRGRLQQTIAGIEADLHQLQDGLTLAARLQVQEDYLASQLQRLDAEITAPAGAAATAGVPGGVERRAAPRPAPIPMPRLAREPVEIVGARAVSGGLIQRARRLLAAAQHAWPAQSKGA
ncbi:MAG TPA: hypothetical protein VGN52_21320 [Burkholderiales bacterium]